MTKHLALIGLLLVAMLTGCSHDESTEAVDSKQTNVSADFVSADEATTIAEAIQFGSTEATTADGKATTRSAGLNKEVQSVTPVPDASGVTAFYVINYKGGGFMLLAADKRVNPVLAYSETSTFPMDNPEGFPEGLVDWMTDVKERVQTVRAKQTPLTEELKAAWETSSIQVMLGPPPGGPNNPNDDIPRPGGNCKDEYASAGPLTATTWDQGKGYNNLVPKTGCNKYDNGRAPVGCVAVAVAQIMKYHRFPNSYNWNAMPNGWATTETAKLMRDVGSAVRMEYGCNGSSSNISKAIEGLRHFGYSAKRSEYNPSLLIRELEAGRPVILKGGRSQGWIGLYVDGHQWVCDGYKQVVKYTARCIPSYSLCFRMNWGWGGDYNDWYFYDDWHPGGSDHTYKKEMIYEIIPR